MDMAAHIEPRHFGYAGIALLALALLLAVARAPQPAAGVRAQARVCEGALPRVYTSASRGFSLCLPEGYTIQEGADEVAFIIPKARTRGTNLGTDSYLGVRDLADAACEDAATTGATAGNRYEDVRHVVSVDPCRAVHYYIHSGAIQNYPQGTVTEFDRAALIAEFDQIRRTLVAN